MKLPNYQQAIVPQKKITQYLLSLTHPDGKSKAKFFLKFSFTPDAWEIMASAFMKHIADHELVKIEPSPFGTRYVIECELITPDGRNPCVRSIWFIAIEDEDHIPQLVSAYPLK